jgi:DNA-binding CsgD family transcriptional regulator
MPTNQSNLDRIHLTPRQREVWEMTHGIGAFDEPMNAKEIAAQLGITDNAVYVTRRRVRQILEQAGIESGGRTPKRIMSDSAQKASHLDQAIAELEAQYNAYDSEEAKLQARIEQISREKPEVKASLDRLRAISGIVEEVVAEDSAEREAERKIKGATIEESEIAA